MPLLFLLGGCLCLTLALAVFGAVFFWGIGDSSDSSVWKPLIDQVDHRALAPETVLLPLTEIDSADALSAALDQAHLENAYAIAAYDPNLSAATRIGALLQLGTRYATAKDTRKASSCYQAAVLLVTLSPGLSDQARLDTYQQASAGLRGIGAKEAARFVTDQAYLVAQYSPSLSRTVRVRRLEQIAEAYAALGANSLSTQARAKSVEAAGSADTPIVRPRVVFVPAAGVLPTSKQVDVVKQTRIAAAKQLVEEVAGLKPGAAWPADSVAVLSNALRDEDQARQAYYDQQLAQVQDPAVRLELLRDRISWLALKYRVARGAFGKSLGAEWNKESTAIAEAWGTVWDDYFRFAERADRAGAVPQPQNPDQALEDVIRQELIAARWGWYRVVPEKELVDALSDVNQKLIQATVPALRVDTVTRGGKTRFLLLPDDLYGQNEKALPR